MRRWFASLCLGAAALAFALTPMAFAQAEEDDENSLNPQQLPDSSFIYDTSIADLEEADAYYDGQTVQVVGEVVGDSIMEGFDTRHRWVTLATAEKGTTATISVYMSSEAASKIDTFGAYGKTGTMLQVRGTFHLVCAEHEGVTDLHAESVRVVAVGESHQDAFAMDSFIPGIVAIVVGLSLMGVFYYLRERQR